MMEKIKTKYVTGGDNPKLFFTSDTHFGHELIRKVCYRPFDTVDEMDERMIENWNNVVGKDDIVFHLGDFAFGGSQLWNGILERLNGHKILILGNHDRKNYREGYSKYFDYVGQQLQLNIDGRSVYLNLYPFLCYGGTYRRDEDLVYQLFGHVHTCPERYKGKDFDRLYILFPYQYDVGVDNNNFTPISWEAVNEKINEQKNGSKALQ